MSAGAEDALRRALADGDLGAWAELTILLGQDPARHDEAEALCRDALARGAEDLSWLPATTAGPTSRRC